MKRRDAMARLDAAVCMFTEHTIDERHWRAYRRALRDLLRERAEAAVDALDQCWTGGASQVVRDSTRAAVLGRRK